MISGELGTPTAMMLDGRSSVVAHPVPTPSADVFRAAEDADLVAWARGHDAPDAFAELVRRHESRIRALLMRLTRGNRVLSEDLKQEAFLRAYKGLPRFEGRARFSTWVHRIAYYAFLNHSSRVQRHAALPEGFENTAEAPQGELSSARSDLRKDIAHALGELPLRYREVIEMHFLRHVPYQDIADRLGLPLGTVKTQLHRAKLMMRTKMDGWATDRGQACAVLM